MLNPLPNSDREVDSLTSVGHCVVTPEALRLLNLDDITLALQPFGLPVLLYASHHSKAIVSPKVR